MTQENKVYFIAFSFHRVCRYNPKPQPWQVVCPGPCAHAHLISARPCVQHHLAVLLHSCLHLNPCAGKKVLVPARRDSW